MLTVWCIGFPTQVCIVRATTEMLFLKDFSIIVIIRKEKHCLLNFIEIFLVTVFLYVVRTHRMHNRIYIKVHIRKTFKVTKCLHIQIIMTAYMKEVIFGKTINRDFLLWICSFTLCLLCFLLLARHDFYSMACVCVHTSNFLFLLT